MARCRECSAKVARSAEYCLHCGVRDPAKRNLLIDGPKGNRIIVAMVVGVILFGWWVVSLFFRSTATISLSCKDQWTLCVDNSDLVNHYLEDQRAQFECKSVAIKQARYGDPKFPWAFPFSTFHTGTDYPKTGIAVLIEEEAQYQNGSARWSIRK